MTLADENKGKVALSVGRLTHVGQVRSRNEDAMDLRQAESDDEPSLFVVADGMGGHSAGNVASQMAVEQTLGRFFEGSGGEIPERLRHAIEEANRRIYEAAQSNPDYFRMGTTIVSAVVTGNRADVANVGDSRVYIVRNHTILQITRDHSWVALQVEMGELTPEEAQVSQNRSVLLRCLGERNDVLVDIMSVRLRKGDFIILCTDGLHGLVTADEIRGAVTSAEPQKACDDLVALANARGGHDNITVQVIRVDNCPDPSPGEGEEISVQRIPQAEIRDNEAPSGAAPPPLTPPTYVPAPAPAQPIAPSATRATVAEPFVAGVPWMLVVFAVLVGAILAAVVERGYFGSVPASAPMGSVASPTTASPPMSGPLTVTPTRPPQTASPSGSDAIVRGVMVLQRSHPISSLAVHKGAIYWTEDNALWYQALQPTAKPARIEIAGRVNSVASNGQSLFVATDQAVGTVDAALHFTELTRWPAGGSTNALVRVAASAQTVFWVQNGSDVNELALNTPGAKTVSLEHGSEDVDSIVVPAGATVAYWAESKKGILRSGAHGSETVVSSPGTPITTLAANGRFLYWTEDAGDSQGTVRVRRADLDGKGVQTIMSLSGAVSSLAVTEKKLYWVVASVNAYTVNTGTLK